ncbi:MAG TPA: MFS transporter [Bacteroidia bacterium]|nr:MFS transporter [Bacteroidia bacterium]
MSHFIDIFVDMQLLSVYKQAFSNLQRNIWVLSIAMFINRCGSMVLLFTSLYLTRDLHFSIANAGMVMSCYGIGSVLGSYFGGWLTDRRSYYDIMVSSLLVCAAVLMLMTVVTSLAGIAAIMFFYAFTADVFRPANSKAIAVFSDSSNRTRSVSLVRLAVNLGFSVGPAVGGFVAVHLGYTWLFVIDAATSVLAALMLMFYLPRKKVELKKSDHAVLNDVSTSAYRDWKYLLFIVGVAIYGTCFFQIFASVPQYFNKVCHYSEDVIGLLLALNGFLVVLIEMPMVMVLEKNPRTYTYIIAGVLCLPISFLILKFGAGLLITAIIYTIVITFSEIFAMPFMMNYSLSRPKKERQGQYSALYSIAYGIANIAAPSVGLGIAAAYGFDNMFNFIIVLSCLLAIGFYWLKQSSEKVKVI